MRSTRTISLPDDFSSLCVTTSTRESKGKKEQIISQTTTIYPLQQVTLNEIRQLRMSSEPGFILKSKGIYLYTPIPESFTCSSSKILGPHCCTKCLRFSSKLSCDGGCEKVRDSDFKEYKMLGYEEDDAFQLSKRLEKYPFISEGYETFNTDSEFLVVTKCNRYKCK